VPLTPTNLMAYCTNTQVKTYLNVTSTSDDTLITTLIARAQAVIDTHTKRTFESSTDTREFTVGVDTEGRVLFFDEDIITITTVTSNADSTSSTTISSTEYITKPRNRTPYYGIEIKKSVNKDWTFENDPESGITVAGDWAYSTAPPDDIVHACIRLSSYYYRQKDSQVFADVGIEDAGQITVPLSIPEDVRAVLLPYIKNV